MQKKFINKLDTLWRKKVKENFGDRCVICGREDFINIHHYISRSNRAVRWFLENGVPCCPLHHSLGLQSFHKNPEWAREQILDLWGGEWLKNVVQQGNKVFKGTYQQVLDYLEDKTENYV